MHSAYPLAALLSLAILAGCVTQEPGGPTYHLEARTLEEHPETYLDWSNVTYDPPEIPELLVDIADPTVPCPHNWTGLSLSEDRWKTLEHWFAEEWTNQTGQTQHPYEYPIYYEGRYYGVALVGSTH